MVSIGGVAIAGMALGAGERETGNQVFRQTIALTLFLSAGISVLIGFGFGPMLRILHADERVIVYFQEYYRIMLLELPIMVVNSSLGMFVGLVALYIDQGQQGDIEGVAEGDKFGRLVTAVGA